MGDTVDVTSARLRCGHNGCEGQGTDDCMDDSPLLDHSFGIGPLPAYASPGPGPGTTLFVAASGGGGGDQTEEESPYPGHTAGVKAQCGICAHL